MSRLHRAHVLVARAHLHLWALLHDERGQAIAEYSLITYAVLIGGGAMGFAIKWHDFGNQSLGAVLYQALQTYVNSVNYALSLAAT